MSIVPKNFLSNPICYNLFQGRRNDFVFGTAIQFKQ